MERELIKSWCSENIYILNMVSSMINDAFGSIGEKDNVSLNVIGRIVPFEEEDAMILERVLELLGYKNSRVRMDRRSFPLQRVSINFSWSDMKESEDWLFDFLSEERKKNYFWIGG